MQPNQRYAYFSDDEVVGLYPEFVAKLDLARKIAGFPFIITSGYRSPEKNQSIIGAVPDSAHLKGMAVDLRVENSHEVWKMITALEKAGITRIGVYLNNDMQPVHVHCDMDSDKVQEVLFHKKEASNV